MISGLIIAAAIIPVAYDNLSVLRHIANSKNFFRVNVELNVEHNENGHLVGARKVLILKVGTARFELTASCTPSKEKPFPVAHQGSLRLKINDLTLYKAQQGSLLFLKVQPNQWVESVGNRNEATDGKRVLERSV